MTHHTSTSLRIELDRCPWSNGSCGYAGDHLRVARRTRARFAQAFTVNRHYLTSFRNYLVATFGADAGLYDSLRSTVLDHDPFARVASTSSPLAAIDAERLQTWSIARPGAFCTTFNGSASSWARMAAGAALDQRIRCRTSAARDRGRHGRRTGLSWWGLSRCATQASAPHANPSRSRMTPALPLRRCA